MRIDPGDEDDPPPAFRRSCSWWLCRKSEVQTYSEDGEDEACRVAVARTAQGVSDSINWRAVHASTRIRPTATTFGWRAKLLFSSPPFLVLGFWAYAGVFNNGALAMTIGLPMLWADLWWLKQVWVAGRELSAESRERPEFTSSLDPIAECGRRPPHQGLTYLHKT